MKCFLLCAIVGILVTASAAQDTVTCNSENHEVEVECRKLCPEDCINYGTKCTTVPELCVPGCECDVGYVRNIFDDTCVSVDICREFGQCNVRASFKDCRSACPKTCDDLNPSCDKACNGAGCECDDGYVDNNGKCVLQSECPK